ncbi:MAG: cysteine synthase A, partial [Bacillota bacterium]|nr:cysteine synthase A [Bacillota bacterium]
MIYKNLLETIGNTPIIQLKKYPNIYVKLENCNPGGSIKDRAALGMIESAEKKNILKAGMHIIEPSSGNTGIAIAMICKLKGYEATIVMPDNMSIERQSIIKGYGANLVLTEASKGMKGSIEYTEDIAKNNSDYVLLQQFKNISNSLIHYNTTAKEIIKDLPDIDIFIAGVGTGGTIAGVGKRLKEYNSNIKIIAIEPYESSVLNGGKPGLHMIQGIGAGFIPDILDVNILDQVVTLKGEEVINFGRDFYKTEGLFLGISSMANILGAIKLKSDKKILTIAPDGGEKYLSTDLYIHEEENHE